MYLQITYPISLGLAAIDMTTNHFLIQKRRRAEFKHSIQTQSSHLDPSKCRGGFETHPTSSVMICHYENHSDSYLYPFGPHRGRLDPAGDQHPARIFYDRSDPMGLRRYRRGPDWWRPALAGPSQAVDFTKQWTLRRQAA